MVREGAERPFGGFWRVLAGDMAVGVYGGESGPMGRTIFECGVAGGDMLNDGSNNDGRSGLASVILNLAPQASRKGGHSVNESLIDCDDDGGGGVGIFVRGGDGWVESRAEFAGIKASTPREGTSNEERIMVFL